MAPSPLQRVDYVIGEGLERMVRRHHRRRLARIGRTAYLDPPPDGRLWAAGDPPPRPGCALELSIDGEDALGAIGEAMKGARSHVHISGWHLSPDFRLGRGPGAAPLRELLAELAERVDVRVLLWA